MWGRFRGERRGVRLAITTVVAHSTGSLFAVAPVPWVELVQARRARGNGEDHARSEKRGGGRTRGREGGDRAEARGDCAHPVGDCTGFPGDPYVAIRLPMCIRTAVWVWG